ncbi:hypothetical protein DVS77_22060 [Mycolicibacterium moriokaense]|nr:hypothetical protein DVS77_22060 [Mycolicibacterium moriokaense]
MIRLFAIAAAAVAVFGASATAAADPAEQDATTYLIGKCYDPSQPPVQRPESFAYNCDNTGVMADMTWTEWGADGARGTGTDRSVECQPSCAEGATLVNPILVHAWNPVTAPSPACPPDVKFYTDMTIAYPAGVPPWITPGATWSPGTDFVTIGGLPTVHYSQLTPTCAPL